ncbi:5-oxoprolinase subunit PxpA [Flavobacteriaceae bacterium TP-CH-4]|uniref:5-oxoprolinase subunit PxpA n=1 Tax=Pelagihabitans pacificus TaxID=2696054 RepID=A0A967AUD9_9FLAO|nr:5-oxoprolinase subunit PxpA [Pelagihabitans pacificus]NHF60127.1 5-oxoprolinase subunit PxpA [Pelagihabitans pacificus]
MFEIDINCDVGEGMGNEGRLMPLISSCNIACGGHAGDVETMRGVVRLAKTYQVKIGAHPSYPDRENFGRISVNISERDLIDTVRHQIQGLESVLREEDMALNHIKPHGALYNDLVKDEQLASTFLKAIEHYKEDVWLYVPYGSMIEKEASNKGFGIRYEAFADRNYNEDLSLVSRTFQNAVIESPEAVLGHLLTMVRKEKVNTIGGKTVPIKADTFCIHGDTKNALHILAYLSEQLPNHDISIKR